MTQIFDRSAASIGLLVVLLIAACGGSDGGTEVGRTHAGLTPGDIVADDFHTGVLDTQVWQVVDPQGDGTVDLVGAGTPDAHLQLSVPTGVEHDAWTDNTTLRAMQPALDEDFEIEVKFESEPTQQYQSQGVLVEQDGSNYIRFDVFYAGGSLRAFSATFSNGAPTVRVHSLISSGPTIYLRLARSGDQWTARYSYDGVSWATATSFSHALTVSSVGVFAGNFWPNPPYTAVVDYFYETSVPISPEDPPLCNPADPLILTTQGTNGTILRNPDQSSYSCGDVVTLTAQPDPGATFVGWGGALSGTTNPVDITINEDTTVTATFDLDTTPPQVSNINVTAGETSATVSWQTDELSIGDVEYGLTTSYELGFVASSTLSTAHSVTLPGLSGGQVYHYRITAEDSFGNSLTGADATFTTAAGVCVLTTQATNGTILRSPNAGSYACGTVVTLTAQPNPGGTFLGWGGALSGTANPEVLTIDADTTVTASFALDATPPQVSNINVTAGETSATVSWQTDELSIGDVEYGLTTSYELGFVASSTLSTAHSVTLPGLSGGQVYHYRITAEDSFGNSLTGADATFTTAVGVCVLTTQATNGTILRSPNAGSYACGTVVTLTAQPNPGGTFLGWGGALSGTANPEVLTIDADTTVTASFALDATPPQVSNINVTAGETSATVSWQTDELSIGDVEYGLTTSYELGSVVSSTSSTSHAVSLLGLNEGQTYHYRVTAEDSFGNGTTSADATFTTNTSGGGTGGAGGSGGGSAPGAFLSDDFFDAALDPVLWEVVDPQGDGTVDLIGAGTPDAHLLLSVPAGTVHDAWTNNTALRVMQPASDEDFEIEVKFESEPTQKYQSQGVLAEQDPSNYVRFDVYTDGSSLRAFVATFTNGSPSVKANQAIAAAPTTYLRLSRSGDQWTAQYSDDGLSWTTATSFAHSLTVTSVGPFAGNFSPNPPFTAVVDYFFETGSPIDPEDGLACTAGDQFTVAANSNGPGAVALDPDLSSYGCGEVVTLTAQPDPGATFVGWSGAINGTSNPATLTVSADANVNADFAVDSSPPQISNVTTTPTVSSATISWQTDEVSTGLVEYGLTTSYELGTVPSSTTSTTHSVTLNGLSSEQIYHFRITAEDGVANSATTGDYTFTTASSSGGPTVDVWYGNSQTFGALGEPQQWVNVLGQVYDPDGLSLLTYSLNGGAPQSLSQGPFRRLAEPGDFNVELDFQELSSGNNVIAIRAVDALGNETIETVNVSYTPGSVWPLPYQVDWSAVAQISDVAQIVDGRWSIVDGELTSDLQRYDRIVAIGDLSWTDYEVTVPFTVRQIDPEGFVSTNGAPGIGAMLKWPGHTDWTGDQQPNWGYYPAGGAAWVEFSPDGTGQVLITDFQPGGLFRYDLQSVILLDTTYIWKVRVTSQSDGSALYQIKTWPAGDPEPVSWQVTQADGNDVGGGSLALIAHFADVRFGNVTIEPL